MGCAVPLCPFCNEVNKRYVYLQPPMARPRVLLLENLSILSAVCLLRDIRSRLFGPVYEYLDLIIGANEGKYSDTMTLKNLLTPWSTLGRKRHIR